MRLFPFVFLFLLNTLVFSQKEILKDPQATRVAQQCVDYLNNYQFDKFDIEVEKLQAKYSTHPSYPLLKSMALYYQSLIDMNPNKEDLVYINLLNEVVDYSEELLKEDPDSKEALFFALSGYGYRAQYYSNQGAFIKVVGEGKKAYKYYKKGQAFKEEENEFYFMTGLFNYYIEKYPENHPIIKPMMGFFQKGNKELGLQQLDYATKNGMFTQGSAYTYISYLYTKFECNYDKSAYYTKKFYEMNPKNTLNKCNYIMALLFNKQYEKALPLIYSLKKEQNEFFLIAYHLYYGWYVLEKDKNVEKALTQFEIVELMSEKNKEITSDFLALTNYKKAQIYQGLGRVDEAKESYKNAINDSSFEEIKKEYKSFQELKK